jgi:tetratricopeptide (TPR) repeat protein
MSGVADPVALLVAGRPADALVVLADILARAPADADAWLKYAVACSQLGRNQEALRALDQALVLAPDSADASNMRGIVLLGLGRRHEALSAFARAAALRPDFVDALYRQGTVLTELGQHAEAVARFDRALAHDPAHANALQNRGNALFGLERFADALASYCAAQSLLPEHRDIGINIGTTLQRLGRHREALEAFEATIARAPDNAAAHNSQGNALIALERVPEALAAYDRALALDPENAEAHYNRATALLRLDRVEEALAGYDRALALRPAFEQAWLNRGVALQRLRRHREALTDFGRAQALDPNDADAHWNESLSLLALGDFAAGWRKYEWRWAAMEAQSARRDRGVPLWLGEEALRGRRLLIHAEQGFGDTLQFCRYLPLLPPDCRILFEVQPPLLGLMHSLDRDLMLVGQGAPVPRFDLHCPLLSLPLVHGTTLETIPAAIPYLRADPKAVASWRARLAALPAPRIGLCWAGNPRHEQPAANAIDRRRSMKLEAFVPLAAQGASFVSLQKGTAAVPAAAAAALGLHDWTGELDDFAATAALVTALDLVITVDTAVAHLAGALGRPVWILHRFDACWRWLSTRADSPWYPTARLFHQPRPGDWASVVAEAAGALRELARP